MVFEHDPERVDGEAFDADVLAVAQHFDPMTAECVSLQTWAVRDRRYRSALEEIEGPFEAF